MTVDEFIDWLYSSKDAEPCEEDLRTQLHALVYTETKRCAGCAEIIAQLAETEPYRDHEIARRFRAYAEDILRTSPGKVGG